jgi:ATP-dependent DNA helicase RecG
LLIFAAVPARRIPRLSELPEQLSAAEFWERFGDMEHEQLDFKESAAKLTDIIPAMAMTDGGIVICGVTDKREIIGYPLNQKTLDRVYRAAAETHVEVQTKELEVDGLLLTLVAIPEVRGRIVTTPDGRLLRRTGSDNQPLRGDALGRFVREREDRPGEDEPVANLDFADLDRATINRVLASEQRPLLRGAQPSQVSKALVDLGVAEIVDPALDPVITRSAALLFAHKPSKYVKAATIQVVRRTGVGPGPSPVSAREDLDGPIPELLDRALAFIEKHTGRHEAVIGTHRESFPEYPAEVLREAILNALAHRDYDLVGATVDVTLWDDRIEIKSPGSLPGHITPENMRDEHYSRNRNIMRVLKALSLVEEYGEGVDRMYSAMEARLMEPPRFSVTPSSVTVTLYNRSTLDIDDQAWLALLGHLEDLTGQERRALVIARHESAVTPRRLRAAFGEDFDADSLISNMVTKGYLVRVGRGGGARYVLSDEIVMRAGGAGVEARSRKRQMLLDELHRRGDISTAEATDFLGESDRALVRQMLDDLVRRKQAIAAGRTRGRRYYVPEARRQTR